MRRAMGRQALTSVYNRVAGHYDFQHWLLTAGSDQRGRRALVKNAVSPGDHILDCGSGTGATALLAMERAGKAGRATLFDMSEEMLALARKRFAKAGFRDQVEFGTGDILDLPFDDNSFDVVLSTYSLCPVIDPAEGARELFRVTRPGGRIGVAHSVDPGNPAVKWLADRVEDLVWHVPSISLGCRSVSVAPALQALGCEPVFSRRIGVPLWPFLVFVVRKPAV